MRPFLLHLPLSLFLHEAHAFLDVELARDQLVLEVGKPLIVVYLVEQESTLEDLVLVLEIRELTLQPPGQLKSLFLQGWVTLHS